ncbi:MAG: type II toxin-antitoxin system RelE/ParE family toxin [Candidatus Thermoplasmatota archaeon]|nr:type II toxin-antitoxin system RelE/ParE family toxin [Candidatus Thermoplasmatota archaeon]
MYYIDIKPELDKILDKMARKDKRKYDIIFKKISEIVQEPNRYKNLKKPLQHLKRVHIDTNFVLTFSIDEESKTVTFVDFDHHDNVYKQK